MTRATLFDLFGPEIVPVHMAEVEHYRQLWQGAYYRQLENPKGIRAKETALYREAYEEAVTAAKKAFKANFKPGGQP